MLEIYFYGRFTEKAQIKQEGKGKTVLEIHSEKKIKDILKELGINPKDTGDLFLDFIPASIEDIVTPENTRLAVFPKEMHFPWVNIY